MSTRGYDNDRHAQQKSALAHFAALRPALSFCACANIGMQRAGGGVRNTLHTRNPLRQRPPPLREVKDAIHERDQTKLTAKCSEKAPMIAAVARRITWSRLWDSALDLGDKSVKGLQYLSRAMSHHGCGNHPCPLCDTAPLPATVLDHLLDCHSSRLFLNPTLSSDGLIDLLQQLHLSVLCNFSKLYTY